MKTLEEKYYLRYFRQMMATVRDHYFEWFEEDEVAFVQALDSLSEEALCLYLRLDQRRGQFYRVGKLEYAECGDIMAALEELYNHGLATPLGVRHQENFEGLLQMLTLPELRNLLMVNGISFGRSANKGAVLGLILQHLDFGQVLAWSEACLPLVHQLKSERMQWLRFLFFGNMYDDLTKFVVRDVGHMRYEPVPVAALTRFFPNRQSIDDCYRAEIYYDEFWELKEGIEPEKLYDWFCGLNVERDALHPMAHRRYDRLCLRLARLLERSSLYDEAINIYGRAGEHPARERSVRILMRQGNESEAIALCKVIISEPFNSDESLFAEDMLNRLELKLTKATTRMLRAAEIISLDCSADRVEQVAMDHYQSLGYTCHYTENHSWRALFAFIFWDVVFNAEGGGFHNPLQAGPSDLGKKNFFHNRKEEVLSVLRILDDTEAAKDLIKHRYNEKKGVANPLCGWYPTMCAPLEMMVEKLPAKALCAVLLELTKNLKDNAKGFPDLMICKDDDLRFIEVKSVNDHLSSQQLHWLRFLNKNGISADVVRIVSEQQKVI